VSEWKRHNITMKLCSRCDSVEFMSERGWHYWRCEECGGRIQKTVEDKELIKKSQKGKGRK